jgi:hypothetical protein
MTIPLIDEKGHPLRICFSYSWIQQDIVFAFRFNKGIYIDVYVHDREGTIGICALDSSREFNWYIPRQCHSYISNIGLNWYIGNYIMVIPGTRESNCVWI